MSESEEKPFTVNDRRKVTPDGRTRDEAADAPAPPGGSDTPAPDAAPGREATRSALSDEPEASPPGAPGPAAGPVDFSQFLLSLGAQAGALLSGAGVPEGVDASEALAHAQSIISILEMLEDKTRGRRTAEEDRLLEDLLFELRMAYVQKRRAAAP